MKRIIMRILPAAAALLIAGNALFSFAGENTVYDWFFLKTEDHSQPGVDPVLEFIKDYDCYYAAPDRKEKVIYLTFDAGYENGNVSKVLDALKNQNVRGSFFILENLVRRAPETVLRMKNEGHLVCNHTARHPDMSQITDRTVFNKQLTDLEKVYEELTGAPIAHFYRPPQGRFTKQNLRYAKDLGYTTVFWSFAYADWDNARQPDPSEALDRLLAHAHPGMILLLHPTSSTNAAILEDLIARLKAEGYRFATLEELEK